MINQANEKHFWVFGYGSLMWNPGFEYVESQLAHIEGLHRAPCIYSWVHRGTEKRPGIVLGLDQGGSCTGLAFKVDTRNFESVINYLRERELVTNVYVETQHEILLNSGDTVTATTYVVDQSHQQYAGILDHEKLMDQIKGAVGKSGRNEAYFIDTTNQLRALNIEDPILEKITNELQES